MSVVHRSPVEEGVRVGRRNNWGLITSTVLVVAFAVVSALLTPRGPLTGSDALITMAVAVVVGLGVGIATGSRLAVVAAPALFIVVFELSRMGSVGPTVDLPRPVSFYGLIALVLGRGVHALLALLPMAIGVDLGVNISRSERHIGKWVRPAVGVVAVVVIGWLVAQPATTAEIVVSGESDGSASIAELVTIDVNESEQSLMIRGVDVSNPVLLYLAGGPGGTDLGAIRADTGLEAEFVVVAWDQRGAGKSYPAIEPADALSLDQLVADTIDVIEYLLDRFGQERLYVVGNSWGTVLGIITAQQRPDLVEAYVGAGQMVSISETDRMFWEDTLAWAEQTGNGGLVAELRSNGPPPYADVYDYEPVVSHEHDWNPYPAFDVANEMPAILFVPEYSVLDRINAFRGVLDTNAVLYPQLQDLDFRRDALQMDVPVYLVQGEFEARGRAVLAEEWFDLVAAPEKGWFEVEGAGHRPHFDDPAGFVEIMRQVMEANGE